MCWSVEEDGREIVAPTFDVLSHFITREQLARELPVLLDQIAVVVDNKIDSGTSTGSDR
jgi:hypothetical protein